MSDLRFDVDAYRERLGEKAFARHQNYLNGEVTVLAIDGGGLVAHVEGSEGRSYVVEIGEGGFDFCSCPAFEEAGVCKRWPTSCRPTRCESSPAVSTVFGKPCLLKLRRP